MVCKLNFFNGIFFNKMNVIKFDLEKKKKKIKNVSGKCM